MNLKIFLIFQCSILSGAFQIPNLFRIGDESNKDAIKDCKTNDFSCKLKQQSCIEDCQKAQASGLGFCAVFGGTYAPFIEQFGYAYAAINQDYLPNLVIASLEGLFAGIAAFCSVGGPVLCTQCGPGIEFEDILKLQNKTENDLIESEVALQKLERELESLTRNLTEKLQIPDDGLLRMLIYEDILDKTDQVLYWYKQKDRAKLFDRIFEQKVIGIEGGLHQMIWTLDKMVRDLITHDKKTFCPFMPYYIHVQTQVHQVAAAMSAKEGTLYHIDADGKVILGQTYAQILDEQMKFTSQIC